MVLWFASLFSTILPFGKNQSDYISILLGCTESILRRGFSFCLVVAFIDHKFSANTLLMAMMN